MSDLDAPIAVARLSGRITPKADGHRFSLSAETVELTVDR
jgi:hypothetical protein